MGWWTIGIGWDASADDAIAYATGAISQVNRLRRLLHELVDADVVRHPRYLAWERHHVRSAVRAGSAILVVVLIVDSAAMYPVAPGLAVLNLPLAVVAAIMFVAIGRRSGPRRNPIGAAFVVCVMVLASSLLPLGLVPQAGPILLTYVPLDILATALFIPWNTLRHAAWLGLCMAMVVAFVLTPFSQALDAGGVRDLLTVTVVSVLVSFTGHVVLQRQRRSMFLQRIQVRDLNHLSGQQGRELRKLADELRAVARVDPLTGVANRLRLDEDLEGIARRTTDTGHGAALMIDIDWFKNYNDKHGHLAGDAVLRRVAAALTAQTRPSDRIYRYGGEEFLVLLPGASLEEAAVVAERQREAVAGLAIWTDRPGAVAGEIVTVSIGVASMAAAHEAPVEQDEWLRAADEAMYASKIAGRNRVTIVGPRPPEHAAA